MSKQTISLQVSAGVRTGNIPGVQVLWDEQEVVITPDEARIIGQSFLGAAEGSEIDAAVYIEAEKLGFDDQQIREFLQAVHSHNPGSVLRSSR